jgi:hypothetical protein
MDIPSSEYLNHGGPPSTLKALANYSPGLSGTGIAIKDVVFKTRVIPKAGKYAAGFGWRMRNFYEDAGSFLSDNRFLTSAAKPLRSDPIKNEIDHVSSPQNVGILILQHQSRVAKLQPAPAEHAFVYPMLGHHEADAVYVEAKRLVDIRHSEKRYCLSHVSFGSCFVHCLRLKDCRELYSKR